MSPKKEQIAKKEATILLGLVEHYLLIEKPVGSSTLQKYRFPHMSSATIRNYFTKLEKRGFLRQQHTSGGRIPTWTAYKFYAQHHANDESIESEDSAILQKELTWDTREVARYLQNAAEVLSYLSGGAIFLLFPPFKRDLITEIKLLGIDIRRYLCILITNFGSIHTEILYSQKRLTPTTLKKIETYFYSRMTGSTRAKLHPYEERIAAQFYDEILLRAILIDSNKGENGVYKTGFSQLLRYSEFKDVSILAKGLSLFENTPYMRALLKQCSEEKTLKFWIGKDLGHRDISMIHHSVIAIPYYIKKQPIGSVAFLGPIRIPYPRLFRMLRAFSKIISGVLTQNFYKYKITYCRSAIRQIDDQGGSKSPSVQMIPSQLQKSQSEK